MTRILNVYLPSLSVSLFKHTLKHTPTHMGAHSKLFYSSWFYPIFSYFFKLSLDISFCLGLSFRVQSGFCPHSTEVPSWESVIISYLHLSVKVNAIVRKSVDFIKAWTLSWDFLVAQLVKNVLASAGYAEDVSSIPGSERPPGEGNSKPLQCSCLEYPVEKGAWWATVHRAAKSWTRLSD